MTFIKLTRMGGSDILVKAEAILYVTAMSGAYPVKAVIMLEGDHKIEVEQGLEGIRKLLDTIGSSRLLPDYTDLTKQ